MSVSTGGAPRDKLIFSVRKEKARQDKPFKRARSKARKKYSAVLSAAEWLWMNDVRITVRDELLTIVAPTTWEGRTDWFTYDGTQLHTRTGYTKEDIRFWELARRVDLGNLARDIILVEELHNGTISYQDYAS